MHCREIVTSVAAAGFPARLLAPGQPGPRTMADEPDPETIIDEHESRNEPEAVRPGTLRTS